MTGRARLHLGLLALSHAERLVQFHNRLIPENPMAITAADIIQQAAALKAENANLTDDVAQLISLNTQNLSKIKDLSQQLADAQAQQVSPADLASISAALNEAVGTAHATAQSIESVLKAGSASGQTNQ